MMEVYEAQWNLQLNAFCEQCEHDVNLLNEPENRRELIGEIGVHIDSRILQCPDCGHSILITALAD